MSDFAIIICGVPQGSVFGLMELCLYFIASERIKNIIRLDNHVLYLSKQPI